MKAMTKHSRKQSQFKEYVRFGLTGALNTVTDFLILNILLLVSSQSLEQSTYAIFKIIAFLAAVVQSYLINKYWVFSSTGALAVGEGGKFLAVSAFGFLINVVSSSLVFSALTSTSGIDERLAANLGAMVGTMLVMLWNYAGYKFFVFRQNKNS
jgi:putative flippase GtrA